MPLSEFAEPALKSLLRQQCPMAEVREEGKITVARASGSYFTMYCPGPHLSTIVRVSAALNCGKIFIFTVTTPAAELPRAQHLIEHMEQSFKSEDELPEGREPRKLARRTRATARDWSG